MGISSVFGSTGLPIERYTRNTDHPRLNLAQWLRNTKDRKGEDDYTFPRCVRRACEFIDEARTMGPFFLWVDSFEAHEPQQEGADRALEVVENACAFSTLAGPTGRR